MKRILVLMFFVCLIGCVEQPVTETATVNIQDVNKMSSIKGATSVRLTYYPFMKHSDKVDIYVDIEDTVCGNITIHNTGNNIKEVLDKTIKQAQCFKESCEAK